MVYTLMIENRQYLACVYFKPINLPAETRDDLQLEYALAVVLPSRLSHFKELT
jgi:hypothetical protein